MLHGHNVHNVFCDNQSIGSKLERGKTGSMMFT